MGGESPSWSDGFTTPPPSYATPIPLPDISTSENSPLISEPEDSIMADSTTAPEIDVTNVSAEIGVCGLRNLGNTCFMNAGIQCLVATEPILLYFLNEQLCDSLDEDSLMKHFCCLFRNMWSGRYSLLGPSDFKRALGIHSNQFKNSMQHDCQEFLAFLLDALHMQMISLPQSTTNNTDVRLKFSNRQAYTGYNTFKPFKAIANVDHEIEQQGSKNDEIPEVEWTGIDTEDGKEMNYDDGMVECVLNSSQEAGTKMYNSEAISMEPDSDIADANYYHGITDDDKILKDSLKIIDAIANISKDVTDNIREDSASMILESSDNHPCSSSLLVSHSNAVNATITSNVNATATSLINAIAASNVNATATSNVNATANLKVSLDAEADTQWVKHTSKNGTLILDTFQGQFRNKVICEVCNFESVTYEPFMYLSVPLPHAIDRQIIVIYIGCINYSPVLYNVTVNKHSDVAGLKKALLLMLPEQPTNPVAFCEVLEHHLSKQLNDYDLVKNIETRTRLIYALEVRLVVDDILPQIAEINEEGGDDRRMEVTLLPIDNPCVICFEVFESQMLKHNKPSCNGVLCTGCLQKISGDGPGGSSMLKCPICYELIHAWEYESADQCRSITDDEKLLTRSSRLYDIPLVYRYDGGATPELFGHPTIIKVPSSISAASLHSAIRSFNLYGQYSRLLYVEGRGLKCSRCEYSQYCNGCEILDSGIVNVVRSDTIAVIFEDAKPDEQMVIRDASMDLPRLDKELTLEDCVKNFSQTERLDEFNPWFCPKCKKNQPATKELCIWRSPPILIVHLKRFIFFEGAAVKIEESINFPMYGFKLPTRNTDVSYDLYATVCHTGSVSIGHYTAYTQNPFDGQWHYFNDERVSTERPTNKKWDYHHAYILFYKKMNTSKIILEEDEECEKV